MLLALFLISLMLIGIGFVLTEANAGVLLSGYNTMSSEARAGFDLPGYLRLFKRFHWFLGGSQLGIGLFLYFFIGDVATGVFLSLYIFAGYLYFFWLTRKFNSKGKASSYGVMALLLLTMGTIAWFLVRDLKPVPLTVTPAALEVGGSFGVSVPVAGIRSVEVVSGLPALSPIKVRGFGMGKFRRGRFKTKQGEPVEVFARSDTGTFLLVQYEKGEKLYYQFPAGEKENLLKQVKATVPGLFR